jgi:hypothetical protein
LEDKAMIGRIKDLQEAFNQDWCDTISNDEKDAICQGIKEANEGNVKPHSQVRNIYEQWI